MSCLKTIKDKGCRLTPQRRLIIDILHNAGSHLTGEDIINQVRAKMPGVNKSTVYRTLDTLVQFGCVFKNKSTNHFIYYHAEEGHHHHLICNQCGRLIECDENVFLDVEKALLNNYGFYVDFKHAVMTGLCAECKSRKI